MTTPEKKLENAERNTTERNTERGATPAVATSPFARSVASLKDAISYGEGRVPETVLLDAAATLERLSQRRELSTEHTVIGFFGATGSGKSTLFNAIAGQNIALSAPTRPTTSTVQAAIWEAEGSEELLDWLGIDKRVYPQTQALAAEGEASDGNGAGKHNKAGGAAAPNAVTEPAPGLFNRIRRAVGGRGEMRTRTGGLILLDMPDFDSVTTTNRDLAARMMRYVDVLVWVVDPQKYADAVIHRDFMVPLAASGAQALCVLNQADKLAPAEVPAVLASLTRLLQAEGTEAHLLSAPIAVSARTGDGVDVLRDLLAQVAAAKSLSLQRTDAQLHATASQLRTYAGGEGTVLAGAYALEAEQKLVKACYTSSQAEQVLQAATASYRRTAGQHTGWILTRWMSRLKADPLRRQDETKSTSKAEKSAGMLGSDSENAPELVASSLPPLSAAQKAGMANAVRQYSKQMAARIDEPWKRSMKEAALSREAELPELLERDMMRIDYGLGRTRAPWVIFNALQWIALLSALVGVGWLTLISGMAYLQIQLPPAPTPEGSPVPLPTLLLLLGILLGIASAGVGRLLTAMGSRYYARKLRGRLQTGVEKAVQSCVVAPVQQEAKRLNAYRKALDI